MARVRVLGAGIIGLSVADELLRRGHSVEVVDPAPASGASYAAAGMLAPAAEVWHGEEALLRLGVASLELWPRFAGSLGVDLGAGGTLLVGQDAGDLQAVSRQAALLDGLGVGTELMDRREVGELELGLGRVAGGLLIEAEARVDPRAVCARLLARVPVGPVASGEADVTVVATGRQLPPPWQGLVRGVRGEIVRLRLDPRDLPSRTVRGWAAGEPIYLVPRASGELVVGATSEEHDAPPVVTAGGVLRLLTAARTLWPAVDRAELVEAVARDRPATRDGLPLVGPAPGSADVVLAAGHYRHGVLLAPLTAQLVANHLESGHVDPALDPARFTLHGADA